ncbi:MAG: hypothetical protein AB1448_10200 [Pseudomonadota bacterium]
MRIKALVAASAAFLVLAACSKAPEEKAEAPATDAVEAAGSAEEAALTVDQAAKDAEAAANQAIQEDTAAQAATTMQGADASAAAPVPVAPAEPAHGPAAAH